MLLAIQRIKTLHLLLFSAVFAVLCFWALNTKVQAATLAVNANCTLNEAIVALNGAADANGCVASGAYGTNDTISLPAGTVTLTENLTAVAKPFVLTGAGKASSIIDGAGQYSGIRHDHGYEIDSVTIKDLTIRNMTDYGIFAPNPKTLTLTNLDVSFCHGGITGGGETISAENLDVHDNTDSTFSGVSDTVGISINSRPSTASSSSSVVFQNSRVLNNSAVTSSLAGAKVNAGEMTESWSATTGSVSTLIKGVVIRGNTAAEGVGLLVAGQMGPLSPRQKQISIDALTIANNTVDATPTVVTNDGITKISYSPLFAGVQIAENLQDGMQITNATVAYNTINASAPDNRMAIAGFNGSLKKDGANLKIVNATVVGNSINQPNGEISAIAFTLNKIDGEEVDNVFTVTSVTKGGSALNALLANNRYNGAKRSCSSIDTGIDELGTIDGTPLDLGHNMVDDQTCTGFTYIANLYDTIDHEVTDNGGPVPTIKLLPGSPAIDGGGQVLGISTDARGVARTGYYSVGAYQGQLLAASTNGGGSLADTGVVVPFIVLGLIIVGSLIYLYYDYRKHKKPLIEADPNVRYTLGHHVRVVAIPLLRYRLSVRLEKKPTIIVGHH